MKVILILRLTDSNQNFFAVQAQVLSWLGLPTQIDYQHISVPLPDNHSWAKIFSMPVRDRYYLSDILPESLTRPRCNSPN